MRVQAKVLATKTDHNGDMLAKLQFNGKLPKVGSKVTVRWGSKRTNSQNAFYWLYLTYVINDCGLKNHGHFIPDGLHESLKAHLFPGQRISTTDMNKMEFGEFLDTVDKFLVEFFGIDTSGFFEQYQQEHGGI